MQDEVIEEIITKVKAKSIMIDNIFKKDDKYGNGSVSITSFMATL
jgi:hypothetical protein